MNYSLDMVTLFLPVVFAHQNSQFFSRMKIPARNLNKAHCKLRLGAACLVFFACCFSSVVAQQTDEKPSVSKESPAPEGQTAAAVSGESGETLSEGASSDGGQFPNTAMSFQTDLFTGRFTYGIPLSLPPARQGSAPALSLSYSSAGANTWCGVGWNLELGFIQRDNRFGVPIKWNLANGAALSEYDDSKGFVFTLSGISARIFQIDTNQTSPKVYRAEVDTVSLRFYYWDQVASPYWEVIDKSGNRFYFGETGNSRVENPKAAWATTPIAKRTFRWALNRVTDNNGNQTVVDYISDSNTLYLSSISYNANINAVNGSTNAATHRVDFGLAPRPDTNITFSAGFRMVQAKRLSNIVVSVSGALVRSYYLNYKRSASTLRSVLTAVTNIGADGLSIAPVQSFQYTEQNPEFGSEVTWTNVLKPSGMPVDWYSIRRKANDTTGGWTVIDLIDMDRDGLPDRVMRKSSSPYTYFNVQRNTGSGFESPTTLYQWSSLDSQGQTSDNWNTLSSFDTDSAALSLLMDVNGDGFPDRVMRDFNSPYTNFYVQLNNFGTNATNFTPAIPWRGVDAESSARRWRSVRTSDLGATYVDLVDMNGDGLPDRVMRVLNSPYTNWMVQFNTGSNFLALCNWGGVTGQGGSSSSWRSLSLNDSAFSGFGWNTYCVFRDINGDGLPDRVMVDSSLSPNQPWVVQFNNGAGFEPEEAWRGTALPSGAWTGSFTPGSVAMDQYNAKKTLCTLMDWNSDGLIDRIVQVDDGETNFPTYSKFFIQLNTGSGFNPTFLTLTNVDFSVGRGYISRQSLGNTTVDLLDINGDGLLDRVLSPLNNNGFSVQLGLGPVPDLLIGASNGIGGSVGVTYVASTVWNNRNKDGGSKPLESNAVSQLNIPLYTVSNLVLNDGNGSVTNSFAYMGGCYDYKNREFRGFNQVEVADSYGFRKRHYFHQGGGRDDSVNGEYQDSGSISKRGLLYRIDIIGSDGRVYATTLNKVEEAAIALNGGAFPYISQSITLSYEGLTNAYRATAKQLQYDTNGNLIKEITYGEVTNVNFLTHSFGNVTTSDDLYRSVTYSALTDVHIRNKPYSTKFTSDAAGLNVLRETRLYYDNRGNVTNEQQLIDGTFQTTSVLKYDGQGNPSEVTDAAGVVTTNYYDSQYTIYPVTKVTGTFTNRVIVDVRSGQILSSIDPKGFIVTNIYDAFFRRTESRISTNAYGVASLWRERMDYVNRGFFNQRSTNYVRRCVYDAVDPIDGKVSFAYADGFGRTLQVKAEAENGQYRVTSRFYDDRANVFFETLPFWDATTNYVKLANTNLVGTWTDYDQIGRAWKMTPGVSVTFDSAGAFQYVVNTSGDSGSPLGSATNCFIYGGDPWASVSADQENKIRIGYRDAFGRTIRITEVTTSGNYDTLYKYDLIGNLTNVTDHFGNMIALRYDTLGRKTNMVDLDMGSWSYQYDVAGRLTNQFDAKGQRIAYFYNDPLGRLIRKAIYNSAGVFVAGITNVYDAKDDADSGYSVGKTELYKVYDREGWQKVSYDERGRAVKVCRYVSANGQSYTTQTAYDDADRVKTFEYPGGVAKLKYSYDSAGNLTNIISLAGTGTQETFYERPVYNEIGALVSFNVRNGAAVTTNSYYANSRRLKQTRTSAPGGAFHQDVSYTFDKTSNIKSITNGLASSYTLSSILYDDLHRLTQVTTASGSKSYAYNAIGNMTSNGDFGVGTYTYGTKPHAVTGSNGKSYSYDANGNMTNRNGQTLLYDEDNRLIYSSGGAFSTVTFGYDAGGMRLWKSALAGTTVYIGNIYESRPGLTLCHVFAEGKRVATFEPQGGVFGFYNKPKLYFDFTERVTAAIFWPLQHGRTPWTVGFASLFVTLATVFWGRQRSGRAFSAGSLRRTGIFNSTVSILLVPLLLVCTIPTRVEAQQYTPVFYYYHSDHLGSTNVLTDRNGVKVEQFEYTSYGNLRYAQSTGAVPMANMYTGQIFDADTGLYFYNARYYDPELGRFVQADTMVPNVSDSQALNRYSYASNNPFKYNDPKGHFWVEALTTLAVMVIVSVVINVAVAAATGGDLGMAAATGAISAGTTWLLGPILGGAAGGAANAALTGGDVGKGALVGGIVGGISWAVASFSQNYIPQVTSNELTQDILRVGINAGMGGAAAAASGGDFWVGFATAGTISSLIVVGKWARYATMKSSTSGRPENNGEGMSDNTWSVRAGRYFKGGGERQPEFESTTEGWFPPFGGIKQNGQGKIFGILYGPGSVGDALVESFSGFHDVLNQPLLYDTFGNSRNINPLIGGTWSAVNVFLSIPFGFAHFAASYQGLQPMYFPDTASRAYGWGG